MSDVLDKVFDALDYEDLLTNADDNGRRKVIEIIKRVIGEEMPAKDSCDQWEDGYNEFRSELLGEE